MSTIRITKIIKKDSLDSYIKDPLVSKISIVRRKNNLNDPTAVKIDLYISIDMQLFHNMIGQCHNIAKNNKIGNGVNSFLNGLGNCKVCGHISQGDVIRLLQIEQTYKINLSIPKNYINLINLYK